MIRFSTVTKDFGTGTPALSDVSFVVEPGEFVFLTGPSGSGKSTLLKLITKEYTPTLGEIEFDGQNLNQLRGSKIHHHRRRIGVVFQDYRLLSELNVWENIALALQIVGKNQAEIEERVTDLLELIQLADKAYHFPAQLSGGESQRVGIARALATAPSVLLADEPTGNLDAQNAAMIAKLFHKIHSLGTTVIFATHDNDLLQQLGHRRVHLEKGKIMSDTPSKNQKTATENQTVKSEKKMEEKPEAVVKPSSKVEPKTEAKLEPQLEKNQLQSAKPEPQPEQKSAGRTRFQKLISNLKSPFKKTAVKGTLDETDQELDLRDAAAQEAPATDSAPSRPSEKKEKPHVKELSLD
jgi:cell division transport system ATP-binding protein